MGKLLQSINNPQNIIFILGVIFYIICLFTITDVALLFFATFVVSCALNPVVNKLEPKLGRKAATTLVLGSFITTIILLFLPIIIFGGNEIANLASRYPQYVDSIKDYIINSPVV